VTRNVKIPEILIKRLKPFGPRFIKIEKPNKNIKNSGKKAIEKGFQNHPYQADDKALQDWLNKGGNYAILAGEGLAYVETDSEKVNNKLAHKRTLTGRSGSGRGLHRIYRTDDVLENGVLKDKNGKNLGNIQVWHKYVVGPDSLHWKGGRYKLIDESEIAYISKAELEEIFGTQLSWAGEKRKEIEEQAKEDNKFPIKMTDLIDISKMRALGNGEYQGEHPIHGSETGHNFNINVETNLWHCFRCNSGGGGLTWIAVKNNIIKCHEAQRGALKGELFRKTKQAAIDEGFEIPRNELEPDVERFFDKSSKGVRTFRAALLAEELMRENTYMTRIADKMMFNYNPNSGTYEIFGEEHIQKHTLVKLGKYTNINRQREVVNYIRISTYKALEDTPVHLIIVKNGVFNIETNELEPFSPDNFILNGLHVIYDAEADCPKFKKFLSEIIDKGDIATIQEFFGFTLLRHYKYQRALLLLGGGHNGKSTLLNVLRAFLGMRNVANESLQNLITHKFSVGRLYGKLANIHGDLPDIALLDTGIFKLLTGGDPVTGEHKFKPMFDFINYAKLIFSCNKIPETKDKSVAYFRRWIIINFTREFDDLDPKTDKNLIDKLITPEELSGILNWALEGLRRLLKNEKFTGAESARKVQEHYERGSDTVKVFLEEWTEVDGNSNVPKAELWEAFCEYCKKFSVPLTLTKRTFGTKMRKTKVDGKKTRVWNGLKLTRDNGNKRYASNGSTIASVHSEKNKSIKEDKEKGEMRSTVPTKKLDEMFKK